MTVKTVFSAKERAKLVWLLRAGKEVHGEDLSISESSEWEGVYILGEKGIEGDIKRMENTY